ncbi:MAG: hypothetical protein C0467_29355 [Planctomycetaceae bacterium]|nr:hypothetical protein [Planctomycetaceae bacterium]
MAEYYADVVERAPEYAKGCVNRIIYEAATMLKAIRELGRLVGLKQDVAAVVRSIPQAPVLETSRGRFWNVFAFLERARRDGFMEAVLFADLDGHSCGYRFSPNTLGQYGYTLLLLKSFGDKNPRVRALAGLELNSWHACLVDEYYANHNSGCPRLFPATFHVGPLLLALDESDTDVRANAAIVLSEVAPHTPGLLDVLTDLLLIGRGGLRTALIRVLDHHGLVAWERLARMLPVD